jgi:hypothetical protein
MHPMQEIGSLPAYLRHTEDEVQERDERGIRVRCASTSQRPVHVASKVRAPILRNADGAYSIIACALPQPKHIQDYDA